MTPIKGDFATVMWQANRRKKKKNYYFYEKTVITVNRINLDCKMKNVVFIT